MFKSAVLILCLVITTCGSSLGADPVPPPKSECPKDCQVKAKVALALSATAPKSTKASCKTGECSCPDDLGSCKCLVDACPCCAKSKKTPAPKSTVAPSASAPSHLQGLDGKIYVLTSNGTYTQQSCAGGRCAIPR